MEWFYLPSWAMLVAVAVAFFIGGYGVHRWGVPFIHGLLVWLTIKTPGWDVYTCRIRAIEPVGPDISCFKVCPEFDRCSQTWGIPHGENQKR